MPKRANNSGPTTLQIHQRISLGQMLLAKRTELGLTRNEIRLATGIDISVQGRVERGEYDVRLIEQFLPLCAILKLKPADVLSQFAAKPSPSKPPKEPSHDPEKLS